jgi:hypothetical protein
MKNKNGKYERKTPNNQLKKLWISEAENRTVF